jgi:hypothetical protein
MLLVIDVVIALISVLLITFVVLVSAQNTTKDTSSAWNITGWNVTDSQNITNSQNGTNTTETKPSDSLTLNGLSPQGESDLSVACSMHPERC